MIKACLLIKPFDLMLWDVESYGAPRPAIRLHGLRWVFAGGNVHANFALATLPFKVNVDDRSGLEVKVKAELDAHSVKYQYEPKNIKLLNGRLCKGYWPDFGILSASPELELPPYLEVKPQEFLYDLRNLLGITRRHGEKFSGDLFIDCGFEALQELKSELWKPLRLAEMTGEDVLCLGTVGGTSSLSITMTPKGLIFRRDHPFVNWTGVLKRKEQDRKSREREIEQQKRLEEQARRRQEFEFQSLLNYKSCIQMNMPTQFDQDCMVCGALVTAGEGHLVKHPVRTSSGRTRWLVCCGHCHKKSGV